MEKKSSKLSEVLPKIFTYLPSETLIKCRQVNKISEKIASEIISERQIIVFHNENDILKFSTRFIFTPKNSKPNLINKNQKLTTNLNLNFIRFKFDFGMNLVEDQTNQFLNFYGKNIKELSLKFAPNNNSLDLKTFKNFIYELCPNIEILTIESLPTNIIQGFDAENEIIPTNSIRKLKIFLQSGYLLSIKFLRFLFQGLPSSLEELELFLPDTESDPLHMEMYKRYIFNAEQLKDWQKMDTLQSPRGISCNLILEDDDLDQITQLGFKLKKMEISYIFKIASSTFKYLLESLSEHLEELNLTMIMSPENQNLSINSLNWPTIDLKLLKTFNLTYFYYNENANVEIFKILNKMPHLEKLNFDFNSSLASLNPILLDLKLSQNLNMAKNLHLKSLIFSEKILIFSQNEMEILTNYFPNVRQLQISVDDMVLNVICKKWQKLEELHIFTQKGLSDESFTGIPNNICREIEKKLLAIKLKLNEENLGNFYEINSQNEIRKNPIFIGLLKELKSFSLIEGSKCELSDIFILFGLVHLKNLTTLSLDSEIKQNTNTNAKKTFCGPIITDLGFEAILNHLKYLQRIGVGCKHVSEKALISLRDSLPNLEIYHSKGWYAANNIPHSWNSKEKLTMPTFYCNLCRKHGLACTFNSTYRANLFLRTVSTTSEIPQNKWQRFTKVTIPVIIFALIVTFSFVLLIFARGIKLKHDQDSLDANISNNNKNLENIILPVNYINRTNKDSIYIHN